MSTMQPTKARGVLVTNDDLVNLLNRDFTKIPSDPRINAPRLAGINVVARPSGRKPTDWSIANPNEDGWQLTWADETWEVAEGAVPQGIAIDAAMEFMDRMRERNIPSFIHDQYELMRFCVVNAWKQH